MKHVGIGIFRRPWQLPSAWRLILLAAFLLCLLPVGSDGAHATATTSGAGPVDWWKADGNARDAAGRNAGTLHNVSFVNGASGKAFSFDGKDSWIDFGPNAGNFGTGNFTIQFWIRIPRNVSVKGMGILGKRPTCDYSDFWDVRSDAGSLALALELDQGSTNYYEVGVHQPLNDGAFHQITFTRSEDVLNTYRDSKLDQTYKATGVTDLHNTSDLIAGRSTCTDRDGTHWFSGQLDDIKLYNRALSAAEVWAQLGLIGH